MGKIAPLVAIVVLLAVVGVSFVMVSPMNHDMGCPLMIGVDMVMCATGVAHFEHWKWALLAVIGTITLLTAWLAYVCGLRTPYSLDDPRTVRYRSSQHIPRRPTLFQELFSSGILNPKTY